VFVCVFVCVSVCVWSTKPCLTNVHCNHDGGSKMQTNLRSLSPPQLPSHTTSPPTQTLTHKHTQRHTRQTNRQTDQQPDVCFFRCVPHHRPSLVSFWLLLCLRLSSSPQKCSYPVLASHNTAKPYCDRS
jgi:hypothetical protein